MYHSILNFCVERKECNYHNSVFVFPDEQIPLKFVCLYLFHHDLTKVRTYNFECRIITT